MPGDKKPTKNSSILYVVLITIEISHIQDNKLYWLTGTLADGDEDWVIGKLVDGDRGLSYW